MEEPPPVDDTDIGFTLLMDGNMFDVVVLAVGMAFLAWLLWLVYRTMQSPRLPVNRHEDRAPNANWWGVVRYLITTPIMVGFWMLVFLLLLSAASAGRGAQDVIVATTAVVGGARLLAHLSEEVAHELAKTVPIAILGFIIIGGGFAGSEQFDDVLTQVDEQVDLIDTYWLGLIVFDMLLTAIWFAMIRWRWLRAERREDRGGPSEGFLGRLGDLLRGIGYDEPPPKHEAR